MSEAPAKRHARMIRRQPRQRPSKRSSPDFRRAPLYTALLFERFNQANTRAGQQNGSGCSPFQAIAPETFRCQLGRSRVARPGPRARCVRAARVLASVEMDERIELICEVSSKIVTAASDWGGPAERSGPPSCPDSHEAFLHEAECPILGRHGQPTYTMSWHLFAWNGRSGSFTALKPNAAVTISELTSQISSMRSSISTGREHSSRSNAPRSGTWASHPRPSQLASEGLGCDRLERASSPIHFAAPPWCSPG